MHPRRGNSATHIEQVLTLLLSVQSEKWGDQATGKSHRKSIIRESIDRFDSLMAIGESRHEAKRELREAGEKSWNFSTGRIHSHKTRITYQEHALRFVDWARHEQGVTHLADLDARSGELAATWLKQELAAAKSPYTLQVERSALRMFFSDRELAKEIVLPRRERELITRSRGPAIRDAHFQPAHYPELMTVERAFGLRRSELAHLKAQDIHLNWTGQLVAHVVNGKGGKEREVPVLAGREADVLAVIQGRKADDRLFVRVPGHADIHSYRREYAMNLYQQYAPGREMLPTDRRLRRSDYDKEAALRVSAALGHRRLDVVLRHYLR
jgi:integrase